MKPVIHALGAFLRGFLHTESGAKAVVIVLASTLVLLPIAGMAAAAFSTEVLRGGSGQNLDIEIIIDTTGSMGASDNSCSISGASRLTCVEAGVKALLTGLNSNLDYVGLMIFPGVSNRTSEFKCPQTAANVVAYSNDPTYSIVSMQNSYAPNGSLVYSSHLLTALGFGSSCSSSLQDRGGVGAFYADIIADAQNHLTTKGRAGAQKVIIFVSDGDANAVSANVPTGEASNQCTEGVVAARAAAATGTWVYSVAYGSPTGNKNGVGGTASCSTDSGSDLISACTAMSDIADSAAHFYSDGEGVSGACQATGPENNFSDMVALFESLSQSLQGSRRLPGDTR